MIAWLIATALLEAAAVSSDSAGSRHAGGRRAGAASAVLSASGEGHLLNHTIDLATTPECAEACDDYQQGVDKDSVAVCIDAQRTCAPAGCGMGLCLQRFMTECTDLCSQWADATKDSFNVCQDNTDAYKCSGQKSCPTGTYRCKQKPIQDCMIFCEGYEFSGSTFVNEDTSYLCQNMDMNNADMGVCLPMPCSINLHNTANYQNADVCKQAFPTCANSCGAGSDVANDTTVCFDDFNGNKCTNRLNCAAFGLTRCLPTTIHQNTANVATSTNTGGYAAAGDLAEKSGMETPKWYPGIKQKDWTAEQQRVRIANFRLRQQAPHNVFPPHGKMMRRDGTTPAGGAAGI